MAVAVEIRDQALSGHSVSLNSSGQLALSTNGAAAAVFSSEESRQTTSVTIATTGNTDAYVLAPCAGTLTGADFSGVETLAANDTNYITFSITNLGQAGAGSAAMLAATDPNTTKATGGTGLTANSKRSLTLSGTAANLTVAKGDRLRVRYAVTGTLGAAETGSVTSLYFTRTA